MKEITRFYWIVNLLDSKLVKTFFKYNYGSQRDFEVIAGCSLNSKEFRKFFDEMVNKEVFIKNPNGYYINGERLENQLKACYLFPKLDRIIGKRYLLKAKS